MLPCARLASATSRPAGLEDEPDLAHLGGGEREGGGRSGGDMLNER